MIESPEMCANQLDSNGRLLHLLTLEGLPIAVIRRLFEKADEYAAGNRQRVLTDKLIVNIFFESSTRTRTAFEASAKRLGADVVNLDQICMAGDTKHESLADTIRTVSAMGAASVVLRHGTDGAAETAAAAAPEGLVIINGGDGCHAHPTQGLTDGYTLRQHFGDDLSSFRFAIVGDVLHSRVARSDLHILRLMGAKDIRLVGPPSLCPLSLTESLGAPVTHSMEEGLDGADAVLLLRVQRERLASTQPETAFYESVRQYFDDYGLNESRMKRMKREVVILHPGPINRGVEIADSVADGPNSLILQQVGNGMAVRMAVLSDLLT